MNSQAINSIDVLNEMKLKRQINQNSISSHNKIKHLTKKYKKFRYLKEKRKKLDLDQLFKTRLNRKENKELNFSNFFSKLNEINELKRSVEHEDERTNLHHSNDGELKFVSKFVCNKSRDNANEDNEHHLLELIKASSTITNHKDIQRGQSDNQFYNQTSTSTNVNATNYSTANKKESKKNLAAKHRERTISLLNELNHHDKLDLKSNENKLVNEDLLIDYYLHKLKECLTKDDQLKFISLLEEFDLKNRKLIDLINKQELKNDDDCLNEEKILNQSIKKIYSRIRELLMESSGNNSELIDEFILFMNHEVVKQLDKQFDFNYWIRIKNFAQKLVVYLNQNSCSLIRLIKLLKQLKQNESDQIDKKRIKSILNKFLNSQPYLLNELNSLFFEEQPLDYLFAFGEDFDEIDLDEEINHSQAMKDQRNKNLKFETINLSLTDEEQNYLSKDCPCKFCHNQSEGTSTNLNADQTQMKHCISCSLKYCKNKIYCSADNSASSKLFTSIEYVEKPEDD